MGLNPIANTRASMLALVAFLTSLVSAKRSKHYDADASRLTRARQATTVITVVVIGIVALVGILIFGEVWDAMPMTSNDTLYSEADAIVTGFGDAMGLVPIILLVLLASIVIAVVQRMRA